LFYYHYDYLKEQINMSIHNAAERQNTLEREVKPHKSGSPSHCELKPYFEIFRFESAIKLERKPKRKTEPKNKNVPLKTAQNNKYRHRTSIE